MKIHRLIGYYDIQFETWGVLIPKIKTIIHRIRMGDHRGAFLRFRIRRSGYPIHTCRVDSPCPVLIGECEGPEPTKWKYPKWLQLPKRINIDEEWK